MASQVWACVANILRACCLGICWLIFVCPYPIAADWSGYLMSFVSLATLVVLTMSIGEED